MILFATAASTARYFGGGGGMMVWWYDFIRDRGQPLRDTLEEVVV